jgi:hypothetical protein
MHIYPSIYRLPVACSSHLRCYINTTLPTTQHIPLRFTTRGGDALRITKREIDMSLKKLMMWLYSQQSSRASIHDDGGNKAAN